MVKYCTLDELCNDIIDCPHQSPKWLDSGIFVIRNFNLVNGDIDFSDAYYVDEDTYTKRTQRAIPEAGDIVFSREAPIGNCAIIPKRFKCCLGQRLVLLKVNHSVCSSEYLLAALQSEYIKQQISQVEKSGSIVSNFNIGDLKNLTIPLPDNQNDIANVYNVLSEKIRNNNNTITALENLVKIIYDYWFLQFDFPDENGRPYRSSGGKMVWNEELKREIPEGWEVCTLRNKYSIERGISYTSDDLSDSNGIPMINLGNIDIHRNYNPNNLKYYQGKLTDADYLNAGDLLIACTDMTRNADIIGCPIMVPNDKKYTFTMDLAKITSSSSKIINEYLYSALRTDFYHDYIEKWASGTNVMHLNLSGLDWYMICIPPIEMQEQYAKLIHSAFLTKCNLMAENQQLASLRDFLLPLLMNGQVTIESGVK